MLLGRGLGVGDGDGFMGRVATLYNLTGLVS